MTSARQTEAPPIMTAPTARSAFAGRAQNIPAGILLMVGAIALFSLNDALGKFMAANFLPPQILLFRSIAALVVLVPIISRMGWRSLIDIERPWLQTVRAVLAAAETGVFYWAVRELPLADAMTYYLAGPIYVTLLATLFLGEKVGWRRWSAIGVGFVGVLVALGPSAASFGWSALIAFTGSVLYAVFIVVTRTMRGTSDVVMATWQIVAGLVLGLVATPFTWAPLGRWYDAALLCLLGVVALTAIVGVNRSLALAPASVVVPYQYTMIIWAVIFGYIFFGNVPQTQTLVGAAIIIAAGLFIYFREQKVGVESEPELPPER